MPIRRLLCLLAIAPCAAHAGHPLITEDTGVLDRGAWQLELHGEAVRGERDPVSAVLGFGIVDGAEVQLEVPRDGDDSLALKWRFYESGPAKLVFKPLVTDSGWGANFVGGYELGALEAIGHLGYLRGDGESSRHASAAFLWAVLPTLKLAADFARDTNPDRDTQVLGLIYALAREIDLGFGRKAGDERAWLFGAKFRW